MKYFLFILFILNLFFCKNETIKEIKAQFEQKNLENIKNYPLITLGYITPWNKEGYEYVEKYSNKFDIISPTWFELKPEEIDGEFQMILDGSNNIWKGVAQKAFYDHYTRVSAHFPDIIDQLNAYSLFLAESIETYNSRENDIDRDIDDNENKLDIN